MTASPLTRPANVRRTAIAAVALMVAAAVFLVGAAVGSTSPRIVPVRRYGLFDWMSGPFASLGIGVPDGAFLAVLIAMSVAYVAVLACSDSLPLRVGVGAIVLLHVLFWLAPPLLSRDVFNYLAYGRMFALHGFDPYAHGAGFSIGDPVVRFVCCRNSPDPYGPGFTLLAAALSHLGLPAGFWVLKSIGAAASLGCVALVWRCARMLGRAPLAAALFVGLNPVLLVFEVGGAHNDALMMLVVLAGMAVFLSGAQARGVALAAACVAVKISGALTVPFMVLAARERTRALLAAAGVAALLALLLVGAFGTGAPGGLAHALSLQQGAFFARDVPAEIGQLLGAGPRPAAVKSVLLVAFVVLLVWQLWRVARGADWIGAAGWTTLGLLASTSWLLPWYVIWLLPLSALSASRRLRLAALGATAYMIWARAPLIA